MHCTVRKITRNLWENGQEAGRLPIVMEESVYFPSGENAHQGLPKETLGRPHQHECVKQRMAPFASWRCPCLNFWRLSIWQPKSHGYQGVIKPQDLTLKMVLTILLGFVGLHRSIEVEGYQTGVRSAQGRLREEAKFRIMLSWAEGHRWGLEARPQTVRKQIALWDLQNKCRPVTTVASAYPFWVSAF